MSSKSSRKKVKAALGLLQKLPPKYLRKNLGHVVQLLGDSEPDGVEFLLGEVDQPLKSRQESATATPFILCEYNRDGDGYRSPFSNLYTPEDNTEGYRPGGLLRKMEVAANEIFAEYAALYYGMPTVSSVYVWGEGRENFAAAVLFLKNGGEFGTWNSTHVLSYSGGTYALTSTILLSLVAVDGMSTFEYSGNVVRCASKKVTSLAKPIESKDAIGTHIANMGEMVQQHENDLRAQIDQIYFGKPVEVASELRSMVSSKVSGAQGVEALVGIAKPKKKKKVWQRAQDEEGNTYYYNSETGATSWEKPTEAAAGESEAAAAGPSEVMTWLE